MERLRTIEQVIEYIKEQDPESALTEWALRQLVQDGTIPSLAVGKKRLVSLDSVEKFINSKFN